MTPFERWLVDNLLEIVLLVGGGIFAFLKLNNFQASIGEEVKKNTRRIDKHLEDDDPHRSCEVERERIASVLLRLTSIESKIDRMDERIIKILQNGKARDLLIRDKL